MRTTIYNFSILFWAIGLFFLASAQQSFVNKDVQSYLPSHIVKANFTLDDAKNLIYKKCNKAILSGSLSADKAYKNIGQAADNLMECSKKIANITMLATEMDEARLKGDLDMFFQKYCDKTPQIRQCLTEFNAQWQMCLTPDERKHNTIMMSIIATLLDFACQNNGAFMALFIAEQGPDCIESNKENISHCMNATLSAYIPAMPPTELPELVVGPKECIDLHDFEKCLLSYVEQCSEATPANIIESLFRYVRNETKCQEEVDKVIGIHELNGQQRNAATGTGLSWMCYYVISVVVLTLNLMYFFFKYN